MSKKKSHFHRKLRGLKFKYIKELRGGIRSCAARAIPQTCLVIRHALGVIDTEIAEKDYFWTDANSFAELVSNWSQSLQKIRIHFGTR